MRRFLSAQSEVVWRCDQTLAKVVLPNPVHHHTPGKGIVRLCQPASELETPACAIGNVQRFITSEELWGMPRHHRSLVRRLAVQVNMHVHRLTLLHGVSRWTCIF